MKQQSITKYIRYGIPILLAISASTVWLSAVMVQAADAKNQGQLSSTDYKFVSEVIVDNTTEISLGQLASQNGSDPSVHQFGTRMVQDHGKVNTELTQLIGQKGATVTETPGLKDKYLMKHLQSLSGPEFDKAYIKRMVADHKEDIAAFQKEVENGNDADIKAFCTKTMPVLQEHLQMAQSIESKTTSPTASNDLR